MSGLWKEFQTFALRGNVVDLAVGVVIGGAFGKIVTSLVDHVIMPPIGLLTGKVDFSDLKWVLRPDNPATPANELVAISYGAFINTVVQFAIIAFSVFLVVKGMNALQRRLTQAEAAEAPAAPPPPPTPSEALLAEILATLKAQGGTGKTEA